MPDYAITVQPAVNGSSLRNFTASFTCGGTPYTTTGLSYFFKVPAGEQAVQFRVLFPSPAGQISMTLLTGPNPPPPPPPPAQCQGARDQTACDAVPATKGSSKGCAWCTSDDKLHALCFDALHEPDESAWSCDK